MSVYTGVVFFRVKDDPDQLVMNLKRGVFFISVLNMTLVNLGQLPGLLEERATYYKQQGAHFYRPQSFLISKILGSLPVSLIEVNLVAVDFLHLPVTFNSYCFDYFNFSELMKSIILRETITAASCSCQATLWTVVLYFMTGLSIKDGSWHFWVFYVIMILTALLGASLVRFMAYFAPDRDTANALIGTSFFA